MKLRINGRNKIIGSFVTVIFIYVTILTWISIRTNKKSSDVTPTTIKPLYFDNETRYAIIVTYQRSGSTVLGLTFNSNPEAFYWFEPIDGVYQAMYGTDGGYNVPADITAFPNGTYRKTPEEERDTVVEAMYNLLTCNLRELPTELLLHRFIWPVNNDQINLGPYRGCLRKLQIPKFQQQCFNTKPICSGPFKPISEQMFECHKYLYKQGNVDSQGFYITGFNNGTYLNTTEAQLEHYKSCMNKVREQTFKCLPSLEHHCKKAKIRSTKVIRMTLDTAEMLLKRIPKLLVIYNLRHPLGISASRTSLSGSFHSLYAGTDVTKEVALICQTMYEDLKTYMRLVKAYPGQVAMVSYEHFANNSELLVNSLNQRLGLTTHEAVRKWLLKNIKPKSEGPTRWHNRVKLKDYIEYKRRCGPVLTDFDKIVPWRNSWE